MRQIAQFPPRPDVGGSLPTRTPFAYTPEPDARVDAAWRRVIAPGAGPLWPWLAVAGVAAALLAHITGAGL